MCERLATGEPSVFTRFYARATRNHLADPYYSCCFLVLWFRSVFGCIEVADIKLEGWISFLENAYSNTNSLCFQHLLDETPIVLNEKNLTTIIFRAYRRKALRLHIVEPHKHIASVV